MLSKVEAPKIERPRICHLDGVLNENTKFLTAHPSEPLILGVNLSVRS